MAQAYIAPTPDLMLPGITCMPRIDGVEVMRWGGDKVRDEPYIQRANNAQATRDAIEKYGYPKLGTRVTINSTHPRNLRFSKKVGDECWIVGYTKASFSSRDGDYCVYVAYNKIRFVDDVGNDVYDHDGLDATWLTTGDGTVVADLVTFGKTQYKKWCTRSRCTLVAMRESL